MILLTLILISAALSVEGWSQSRSSLGTPDDEINLLDLLIARPAGALAGIAGTGIFIVTLPFTVPTKSVKKASKMLITDPFKFSFSRQFPDESVKFDW